MILWMPKICTQRMKMVKSNMDSKMDSKRSSKKALSAIHEKFLTERTTSNNYSE